MASENPQPVPVEELEALADRLAAAGQNVEAGVVYALAGAIHSDNLPALGRVVRDFLRAEHPRIVATRRLN